jgi:hypothetical protein
LKSIPLSRQQLNHFWSLGMGSWSNQGGSGSLISGNGLKDAITYENGVERDALQPGAHWFGSLI